MPTAVPSRKAAFGLPLLLPGDRAADRAPDGAPELAGLAACVLFVLAWLSPNHYPPWPAFHSDALAAAALLAASFGTLMLARGPVRWPVASLVFGAVALVPLLQHAAGLVYFLGDAAMAALYLAALALALQAGAALQARGRSALTPLLIAIVLAGVASVVLALLQWLRLAELGIFVADLEREGRPYANFAQPNQFATFLMLAIVAALVLHQRRLMSGAALALAALFLSFGVVMTQSRAGWLEMAGLVGFGLLMRRRAGLRLPAVALPALGAAFGVIAIGWVPLCEALYLPSVRDGTMGNSGGRLDLWLQMLQAVRASPWVGYGWNQVAVAQAAVAADWVPFRLQVEHAHDIVLDLVLWNGVPLGLLIAGAGAWWLWRHGRACRDGGVAWMLGAVVVLLMHALVEFPHDYAYLLLPVGLLAGAVEAGSGAGRFVTVPRAATAALPVAGLAMLVWVVSDYMTVEGNYRDMRFETARIGTGTVSTEVPDVRLLTQLREFLVVARRPPGAGMAAADLERLRSVAARYGYPPVLLRHATAAALNGRPEEAAEALRRLCRMHAEERCREALDAWNGSAAEQPALRAVALPPRP